VTEYRYACNNMLTMSFLSVMRLVTKSLHGPKTHYRLDRHGQHVLHADRIKFGNKLMCNQPVQQCCRQFLALHTRGLMVLQTL